MIHTDSILIQLDRVSYAYPSTEETGYILKDIDLTIRRGERVAIAGSNGSGKSTLAKVMAGLYPASSGTVRLSAPEQPAVQLVFQNPDVQAVGETVLEDLIFGMENYGAAEAEMPQRAAEALEKTGLAALSDFPVSRLSGGQKQLLAVASCLCVNPAGLIFDEATSMLDPMSRRSIATVAQELNRAGVTVVWITQWMDELALAERVIALEQGQIVFDGNARHFFYETNPAGQTVCELLGFVPPYTVQVALSLINRGIRLDPLPLTPAELGKAVSVHL